MGPGACTASGRMCLMSDQGNWIPLGEAAAELVRLAKQLRDKEAEKAKE